MLWQDVIVCPIDREQLSRTADGRFSCDTCGFTSKWAEIEGRRVQDFRAQDIEQ